MNGLERRLRDLETRVPPRPREGPSEARRRMAEFLDRYAAAKQAGTITEELETEAQAIREHLDRREAR